MGVLGLRDGSVLRPLRGPLVDRGGRERQVAETTEVREMTLPLASIAATRKA
jgi:hypothetical protein